MKLQFQILIFMVILNVVTGVVIALELPATAFSQPLDGSGDVDDYEGRFNATDIADRWSSNPFSGIPVVGDIFGGLYLFFDQIRFLIDGFPMFLDWVSYSYLTDVSGQTAFNHIANVFRIIYAVVIAVFMIEFITGRIMTD